jgi:hypothetical protein
MFSVRCRNRAAGSRRAAERSGAVKGPTAAGRDAQIMPLERADHGVHVLASLDQSPVLLPRDGHGLRDLLLAGLLSEVAEPDRGVLPYLREGEGYEVGFNGFGLWDGYAPDNGAAGGEAQASRSNMYLPPEYKCAIKKRPRSVLSCRGHVT